MENWIFLRDVVCDCFGDNFFGDSDMGLLGGVFYGGWVMAFCHSLLGGKGGD